MQGGGDEVKVEVQAEAGVSMSPGTEQRTRKFYICSIEPQTLATLINNLARELIISTFISGDSVQINGY